VAELTGWKVDDRRQRMHLYAANDTPPGEEMVGNVLVMFTVR
jgi:hypothetical protein